MTREQGKGFGQLYFSLLMSVFSVHLLNIFYIINIFVNLQIAFKKKRNQINNLQQHYQ